MYFSNAAHAPIWGSEKKLPLEDRDAKDVATTAVAAVALRKGDMDGEGKSGVEGAWRTRASTQERRRMKEKDRGREW